MSVDPDGYAHHVGAYAGPGNVGVGVAKSSANTCCQPGRSAVGAMLPVGETIGATAGGLALGGGAAAPGTVTRTARDARERVPPRPSARTR